ncbi:hypothetical protein LguiA_014105 [Lonicera macranthoides]
MRGRSAVVDRCQYVMDEGTDREKVDLQVDFFLKREGLFGCQQAKSSCKKRSSGKRLQLVDEEGEWEDLESREEEDDRAIRYDDDSIYDPLNDGEDENEEFDEFFKPLDTDDSLFKLD